MGAPAFNGQGLAMAVFDSGTVDQLERAAQGVRASGVWAQQSDGRYQLLVVGGPTFTKTAFRAGFPSGFTVPTAVTLVRAGSTTSAPPVTATPAPAPTLVAFSGDLASNIAGLTAAEVNAHRSANGLPALRRDGRLDGAAAAYAALVLSRDPYLGSLATIHSLDGEPWDRATRAGYAWSSFSENIAQLSFIRMTPTAADAARSVGTMWINSASHRDNMLDRGVSDLGVGCAAGRPSLAPRSGATPDLVIICVANFAQPR